MKKIGLCGLLAVCLSSTALADVSIGGGNVLRIGSQGDVAYFGLDAGMGTCAFGIIYIDSVTSSDVAARNRAVALLTAAYLAGRRVSRVDYAQTSDGSCHAKLVEF